MCIRDSILLSGALCKPPIFRRTPLGRSICDLMLAVSRRYGRADYLPVIAWGQLAVQAARLQVGDTLSLEGRVQSRTCLLYTSCHSDCAIKQAVGRCVMPTEGIFAVVVREGVVRPGDEIEILEAEA